MSLPKQVQAQLEEIEAYDRAMQEQNPESAEGTETPPEQVEEQPVAQPETAPVQEPEAPKPEVPTVDEDSTWERRYKALQGKFNAEVPRLHSEVKELKSQLNMAISKLEDIGKAQTAKAEEPERLVTDSDVEAFGSDLIDVIDRKAREVARQMVGTEMAELKAENQKLLEELSGVAERQSSNDRRTFFADLERLVPDYEALNVDDGFLEWLAESDPLSGMARQDYLTDAYHRFDVNRTAALFNTYKSLLAPAPAKQVAKNLARQVAPDTSKVSMDIPSQSASRIWTNAEIESFYRQVQQGKFRDSPAEQVRIEAEIDLAVAEGRIR